MSYCFRAEVVLWQPSGLGSGDCPRGDGYSPHFVFERDGQSIPVRFLDFCGEWDRLAPVTVSVYHSLGPPTIAVHPGDRFEIRMGGQTVGRGTVQ